MKFNIVKLLSVLAILGILPGRAEEKLASLQVGSEVYSNVVVTTVTATDIYFSHARGMGNAKLKNLAPELQKRFKFDPAKGRAVEKSQAEATDLFLRQAATNRTALAKPQEERVEIEGPTLDENGELIAAKLYATSVRGQRPPQIIIEECLTPQPDTTNKFVLVDFFATWAEPAREAIPHLNELQARFRTRLVVIGLSNEPADVIRKMTTPPIHYFVGTDTQARTLSALQVRALPHSILIDPSGIVRYEGHATFLDAANLEKLMARYSQ